jgi:hypothetical protein
VRGGSDFCGTDHRDAFNNLRKARGAEAYDLIMIVRYDRPIAAIWNVWTALCRLARHWREEDKALRAGRASWRSIHRIYDRKPYLYSQKGKS